MFSLTVAFGSMAVPLYFKTAEAAHAAWEHATQNELITSSIRLSDDFGQQVMICATELKGVIFDDLHKSKEARIEMALHGGRTQAAAQQRAATDPTLQQAARGPAVLTPGIPGLNGGFRG